MRHLLVLSVIFSTAAFGAANDRYLIGEVGDGISFGSKSPGGVWDQLITSNSERGRTAYQYCHNYWMADDYEADGNKNYDGFAFHDITFGGPPPGDTYLELYENDLSGTPLEAVTVSASDVTRTDTGWDFSDMPIYLTEIPFGTTWALTEGSRYWTAFNNPTGDLRFVITNETGPNVPAWDPAQQYHNGWRDEGVDLSMRWDGNVTAVKSASLGEVKAAFR